MTVTSGLVIVGAGGFGREVLDVVEALEATGMPLAFRGFLDDGEVELERLRRRGALLLGGVSSFGLHADQFVIGIGATDVRSEIAGLLEHLGGRAVKLVHPDSTIGGDNEIGAGTVVTAGVRVTTNVRIGRHVHLNLNSTIGHDTHVGDFVSVFPGVTISGDVVIGERVTIGTGVNIINGVSIGDGAYIGAGAVVTRDVEPGVTVAGVPAKVIRDASGAAR
jgi:sugar O-acyltransferase (sialic acid O-acetyltransferase NeuD family)